jgi:hypothetical protein
MTDTQGLLVNIKENVEIDFNNASSTSEVETRKKPSAFVTWWRSIYQAMPGR